MPTDFWGDPTLLKLLADLFNGYFNPRTPVQSTHIAVASGAAACLDTLLWNICDEGDGVLIPGPYWSMKLFSSIEIKLTHIDGYDVHCLNRAAAVPILVNFPRLHDPFSKSLVPGLENALVNACHPVKAVILTNPHNPLGQCYPRHILEECLRFCQRRGLHLISEEVFGLSTFHPADRPESHPFVSALVLDPIALDCDPARLHVVWSMSKDFASAGIKVVRL